MSVRGAGESVPIVRAAATLVRVWARFYTFGMPRDRRDARRAEIDSDLWELQQDGLGNGVPPAASAAHMLARLVLGMPHDLSWRVEHIDPRDLAAMRLVAAGAVAAVFVMAALWVLPLMRAQTLPTPPPRMAFMPLGAPPPPPPPPPAPPCHPPAFTTGCGP